MRWNRSGCGMSLHGVAFLSWNRTPSLAAQGEQRRLSLFNIRRDNSGLVAKLPNSRRYQLLPHGYSICLVFLKLFERIYAPLTAGILSPVKLDARLESKRQSQLDRLYQRVIDDLDVLVQAVGLKAA